MRHGVRKPHMMVLLALTLASCGLQPEQQAEYSAIKNAGYAVEEKSVSTATGLGFVFGGGSFYTRQYGLGVLDLILWPYSIFWDPISSSNEAEVINYEASKAKVIAQMKAEIDTHYQKLMNKEITQEEFNLRKYEIERKYDFSRIQKREAEPDKAEEPKKDTPVNKQEGYFK